ncbi:hypothetical protein FKM82_018057 [Ascaphus truei]
MDPCTRIIGSPRHSQIKKMYNLIRDDAFLYCRRNGVSTTLLMKSLYSLLATHYPCFYSGYYLQDYTLLTQTLKRFTFFIVYSGYHPQNAIHH